MRLTEVEVVPYALPFERPYATARGTLERREMLLAAPDHRRRASSASARRCRCRCAAAPTCAAVGRALRKGTRRLRRADLSDFGGDEPLLAAVDAYIHTVAGRRLPAPAKAAIEMAIFDLAGKASGRPLWSLLGADSAHARALQRDPGRRRARTRSPPTPSAGRRAASTPSSSSSVTGDDVAVVRAVRERLGPDARIRVDAERRLERSTRRSGCCG